MTTTYEKLVATPEGRFAFCVEMGITNVTEQLCDRLEKSGMTRSELAKGMGVTPGRITQLLDGNANLTLTSVARALAVFGHVLEVSSSPIALPASVGGWTPAATPGDLADAILELDARLARGGGA